MNKDKSISCEPNYKDKPISCEPNYKDEYNMLRQKCKELAYENEKLKEALIKVVLKLS